MKTFSGQKKHDPVSRQNAQGYLASNAVMPGLGSLAAGQKIGLVQLALSLAGFGLTLGFGVRFIYWILAHWSEFYGPNPEPDPIVRLREMWQQVRWAFLGMGLFAVAWLWALFSSRSLLAGSKPPHLGV